MSSNARKRAQQAAEESTAKTEGEVSPEEATVTGNQTTAVEAEGAGDAGEVADSGVSETEELEKLVDTDQQAAIAGSMGGTDNYPYNDRTAIPLHERNMPAMGNSPLTEASQSELNPAFTPKAEDGGPVTEDDKSIGTEPNAYDQQLAAAQNQGGDELEQKVKEQQEEAAKQQMDVEAVNAAAEERTPEGEDPGTGSGDITPPGAPSGMEPHPTGEAGTSGADESAASEEGASQSDAPEAPKP